MLDSRRASSCRNSEALLVIGGGYIGLELGSRSMPRSAARSRSVNDAGLLPGADRDLVGVLEKRLKGSSRESS
jgi:dihydrolipoamide dehydrogenase